MTDSSWSRSWLSVPGTAVYSRIEREDDGRRIWEVSELLVGEVLPA